jgi:phage baseplate assembly protein W
MAFNEDELGKDLKVMNNDLEYPFDADVSNSPANDFSKAELRACLGQALVNKLRTKKGELKAHPDYGSELHNAIGLPATINTKGIIELYTIEAILQDPRVSSVKSVVIVFDKDANKATIDVTVIPINSTEPLNIVYPFFF